MITDLFSYSFIIRGFEAGIIISLIAPFIGMFLVLRRYSLIADTLSHVSLAGVALGLLFSIPPFITALAASVVSAVAIEHLRAKQRTYGDTALSLFLSGSLALALVLLGLSHGFNANLFRYLFGSIITVQTSDIITMGVLGVFVVATLLFFYRELIYITFDEEAAAVRGIPVTRLNILFVVIAAIAITLAIPIVGILLVSALMIIPVVTALQLRKGFTETLLFAEGVSLFSTMAGMIVSFYADLSPGATIVLIMLALFLLSLFLRKK